MGPENGQVYECCGDVQNPQKSSQERTSWSEVVGKGVHLNRDRLHSEFGEDFIFDTAKVSNLALHEANAKASALDAKLQMTCDENLRLIEDHGKLKRRAEKLEDTIHSILRAIAQEIPTEEGLSRKLISSPKEDAEALIKDLQEALHVYIEHCEHHVSFPLKSALFSVRSELADTQASLWTMQHKLAKQIAGAEENCLKSAHSVVDQSFCDINRDIEKIQREVEELRKQYTNEVAKVKGEYHNTIYGQNTDATFRYSMPLSKKCASEEQDIHTMNQADGDLSSCKPPEALFSSSPRKNANKSLVQQLLLGRRPHFSIPSVDPSAVSLQSDNQQGEDILSTLEQIEAIQLQSVD